MEKHIYILFISIRIILRYNLRKLPNHCVLPLELISLSVKNPIGKNLFAYFDHHGNNQIKFENFIKFFKEYHFIQLIRNTVSDVKIFYVCTQCVFGILLNKVTQD